MAKPRYLWRNLTPEERAEVLAWRKNHERPWHSPPHRPNAGMRRYHITAACYEHQHHIGYSLERMDCFSADLLQTVAANQKQLYSWCVLPNHYHFLVQTDDVESMLSDLGRLHGRSSHAWNGEEGARGRKVFFRAVERAMRSDRHYWATLNYVHHNPVRHGYVKRWQDWPWSSAVEYLKQMGSAEAERMWKAYPLLDYGEGWDDAGL